MGAGMAWLWTLGKALTVLFWWVVLVNLLMPMTHPFRSLINLTGATLMLLHLLEVLFFHASLRGRSHPWFDRLQILLVGIFHVRSIPTRSVQESNNA
ncbi:putative membrane protein [Pseudomonas sp. TE3610]